MNRIVKLQIYRIFYENRKILAINFCVLCFLCGAELRETRDYDFGIWGFVMTMLTNHYYTLYCLVPILLIVATRYIRNIRSIELIRYRNRFQQIAKATGYFCLWLTVYFVIKTAIIFLIGLKTFGLSTVAAPVLVPWYDELLLIFNLYIEYFKNPVAATAAIVAYYIFGFSLLLSVLSYINGRFGYEKVIGAAFLIYILTMIGFKTDLKSAVPFLFFNNYILLHHGLLVNGTVKFFMVLTVGAATLLFCLGFRIKTGLPGMGQLIISGREKKLTIAFVLALILLEILRSGQNPNFSLRDVMVALTAGSGAGNSSFLSWLKLTMLYLMPLFIIGISDQRMKTYSAMPTLIRFGNRKNFENKVQSRDLAYVVGYVLLLWLIGCLTYWAGDRASGNGDSLEEIFGIGYTLPVWHLFMSAFLVNLVMDLAAYKLTHKILTEVGAVLLLLLYRFIFYLVPAWNLFHLNFGMTNLYEQLQKGQWPDPGIALPGIFAFLYILSIVIRRFLYGNHKIR